MHEIAAAPAQPAKARFVDYVAMARPSHWIKHVFIVPGIALALPLHDGDTQRLVQHIVLGFIAAALAASANYVLNEWLDASSDAFHPEKSRRPAVAKSMSPLLVAVEYLLLAGTSLALAIAVSKLFSLTIVLFLFAAWAYNTRPIRTKDHAYLDVLSEALNNPIRLTLGWAMVDSTTLPPASLLLTFWMAGSFLMTMKRFAEYRSAERAGRLDAIALYRRSFRSYTQQSLLIASVLYAQTTAFFLAVFLVKYRIEYLLALPLVTALFCVYLWIALKPSSSAQAPERLFREPALVVLTVALALLLALLTWIDLPFLEKLASPHYIRLWPG